jgi:hypothetical protein
MRSQIPIGDGWRPDLKTHHADFQDDGIYSHEWPDGHKVTVVMQNQKFEILVEFAIEAYCERYFREALLSCASAVDAYMDFHIEMLLRSSGVPIKETEALLKQVKPQAERRIGAFLTVESGIRKVEPKYITHAQIELRNRVVHRAYIPTSKEVLSYLEEALDFITSRYRALNAIDPSLGAKLISERMESVKKSGHLNAYPLIWVTVVQQLLSERPEHVKSLAEYIALVSETKLPIGHRVHGPPAEGKS